jgi:hypothetical protein
MSTVLETLNATGEEIKLAELSTLELLDEKFI